MSNTPTIKINNQEYKLKITLGLYKRLSFPKSELGTILDNASRQFEVLKLAIFYGSKQDNAWDSLKDMEDKLNDNVLEEIDDCNLSEKLDKAVYISLPDSMKKIVDKKQGDFEEESSKKN